MAVTIVSNPPEAPTTISVSYPQIVTLHSDKYGTAGVTQHRFKMATISTEPLPLKFTIVNDTAAANGQINISPSFKTLLPLGPYAAYGAGVPKGITEITSAIQLETPWATGLLVQFFDQYYLNGVFTEEPGPSLNYSIARGFIEPTGTYPYEHLMPKVNWHQYNGLEDFVPYSGYSKQVYGINSHDPSYVDPITHPSLAIVLTWEPDVGLVYDWRNRGSTPNVQYFQMWRNFLSNVPTFERLKVMIYTNTSQTPTGATLEETFYIEKTVDLCEDKEMLVMFQDRFWQWSFISFDKIHRQSLHTIPQKAELLTGRTRYNIRTSDNWQLNTNWMREEQNPLWEDLIAAEQAYLIEPSDGTQTKLNVVPNSLRLKTRRADGMMQYQMSFREAFDNFKP